jgi:hypothetical protein
MLSDTPTSEELASASLARYCPLVPTTKQAAFLDLRGREALFGGAAGGGKSMALLMAALQHVHVPGYAALILRKDTQRLSLAGGLIPRSHAWFADQPGVRWNAARREWSFPTGVSRATIQFGYLAHPENKYRYASSEFHYIAFDELTELGEEEYQFLFSRLRRTNTSGVPLRVRAASNPGNVGHGWVKRRFIDGRKPSIGMEEIGGAAYQLAGSRELDSRQLDEHEFDPHRAPILMADERTFLPSLIDDNPHLDAVSYRQSLASLPPLARERLLHGDWSVCETGLIRPEWLREFVEGARETGLPPVRHTDRSPARGMQHWLTLLAPDGSDLATVDPAACRRIVTIDPAGTSAEKMREARGRPASHSVLQVWDQPRRELSHLLLLRHQERAQVSFGSLLELVRRVAREWRPERIYIENEKFGSAVADSLRGELPIEQVRTEGRDKATRAAKLLNKLERGEVFLPKYETSWRPTLEAEWLAWTGRDDEPTDQIDAAAYAAILAERAGPAIVCAQPGVVT